MYLAAGAHPDRATQEFPQSLAPPGLTPNAPWLTLTQIMALVEKRLRWYGFDDWRIRDALCSAGATVTVMMRGAGRATLAITMGRDGAVQHVSLTQDPPAAVAPRPVAAYHARSLCARAIAALTPEPMPAFGIV